MSVPAATRKVNFTSPQWSNNENVKFSYTANNSALSPCLHYSGNRSPRPASSAIPTQPHLPNRKLHRPAVCLVTLHNLSNLRHQQPLSSATLVLHNLKRRLLGSPVSEAIRSQPFSARHNRNCRRAPPAGGCLGPVQRYSVSLSRRLACLQALRTMQLQHSLRPLLFSPHNHKHSNSTISRDKQARDSSNSRVVSNLKEHK